MSPTETVDTTSDTKKDGVKREISVEIPAEEVAREMEVIIQKYQKVARLPGFRSGHVPASIIKQRFKEDLKSDVVEALVPKHFRKEAEKQGLIPVSQPQVTDLHIHDGEPLRFKRVRHGVYQLASSNPSPTGERTASRRPQAG